MARSTQNWDAILAAATQRGRELDMYGRSDVVVGGPARRPRAEPSKAPLPNLAEIQREAKASQEVARAVAELKEIEAQAERDKYDLDERAVW